MMTMPRIAGFLTLILVVRVVIAAHNGSPGSTIVAPGTGPDRGAERSLFVSPRLDSPVRMNGANPREVLWSVAPGDPNSFGFIPTGWNTQPELLPLSWDVQTVFAECRVAAREKR